MFLKVSKFVNGSFESNLMLSICSQLLPDAFMTQICQTLNNAYAQLGSKFRLEDGVFYHKDCIYIPEDQPRLHVLSQ